MTIAYQVFSAASDEQFRGDADLVEARENLSKQENKENKDNVTAAFGRASALT